MTVPVNNPIVSYFAAGVGPYPIPFPFAEIGHIQVIARSAAGVSTSPAFTIGTSGVTLAIAPVDGTIIIYRDTPADQNLGLSDLSTFPAKAVEASLDRLTLRQQELQRDVNSSLRLSLGETVARLPVAATRANKYLAFNDLGDPIVVPPPAGSGGGFGVVTFNNIAELRAATWVSGRPTIVNLINNWRSGDGGGTFRWDSLNVSSDNSGTRVKEDATTIGRWVRVFSPIADVTWWETFGNGVTSDVAAFTACTTYCQANGVAMRVPKAPTRWTINNWIIPRAGGPLTVIVAENAELRHGPTIVASDVMVSARANNVKISGGIWDGGVASGAIVPGSNNLVTAGSFDVTPLVGFVFQPQEVRNGNANLVDVFGAHDSHVIGGRYLNSGLNLVEFRAGNTAFGAIFDHENRDCSIEGCWGDRRMNTATAIQGCFKFSQQGAEATVRNTDNCTIRDCIGYMAVPVTDTGGNVVAEVWAKGSGSLIFNCRTYGGYIGQSFAKGQTLGRVESGLAVAAQFIGFELAGNSRSGIYNCDVDGMGVTEFAYGLDFQLALNPPADSMQLIGGVAVGIKVRGINIIGPSVTTLDVYGGKRATVKGTHIQLAAANAVGVRVQNVEHFDIDVTVDGAGFAGTQGLTIFGSRRGEAIVRTTNLAAQGIQVVSSANTTTDRLSLKEVSRDASGSAIQFVASGGSFGADINVEIDGRIIQNVKNPRWSEMSATGLTHSILAGGILQSGSPETVVDAAPGGVIASKNGQLYRKSAGNNNTGWVAV